MPRTPTADLNREARRARLTIWGAHDGRRADPESCDRLVVTMARVARTGATVIERALTSSVSGWIPDCANQATEAGSSGPNRRKSALRSGPAHGPRNTRRPEWA
jgi:hypothetical protein